MRAWGLKSHLPCWGTRHTDDNAAIAVGGTGWAAAEEVIGTTPLPWSLEAAFGHTECRGLGQLGGWYGVATPGVGLRTVRTGPLPPTHQCHT